MYPLIKKALYASIQIVFANRIHTPKWG